MDEVAATIAGFRMGEIDAYKSMKYKVGQISGELSNARKIFINRSIGANVLMEDFERIARGESPININKNFNNFQKNRYRIWSEAYKDIEALREMNYPEWEIREMLKGRRAFSDSELNRLMLGYYVPAKVPKIDALSANGFTSMIKEINRKLDTAYLPGEFFKPAELNEIYFMWNNAQLGVDQNNIEDELGIGIELRSDALEETAEEMDKIIESQEADQIKREEEREKKLIESEKRLDEKQSKTTAPIGTPPLETEIFTASRVYPTISGSEVNQASGLTGTEEALLDPMEKLIAQRQNQGLGSLS
jgi:hypothetical protein